MENKVVNKQIPIKSIIDVANYFDDYKSRYDNIFEQEKIKNKNVEFSEKKYEYENGNTELRYTVKLRNGQNMTETDYNWFIGQLGNPRAIEEVFIDKLVTYLLNSSGFWLKVFTLASVFILSYSASGKNIPLSLYSKISFLVI